MDFEDEKTPIEKMGIKIPDRFEGLFDDPPLLEGEDANLYWGLFGAMIKDRNPQGFSEWIYVHDTVNKLWEEGRLKRASTGLMRGEMFSALMYFLRQIHTDGQEPEQTEQTYFLPSIDYQPPKPSAAEKLAFKYGAGGTDAGRGRYRVRASPARFTAYPRSPFSRTSDEDPC